MGPQSTSPRLDPPVAADFHPAPVTAGLVHTAAPTAREPSSPVAPAASGMAAAAPQGGDRRASVPHAALASAPGARPTTDLEADAAAPGEPPHINLTADDTAPRTTGSGLAAAQKEGVRSTHAPALPTAVAPAATSLHMPPKLESRLPEPLAAAPGPRHETAASPRTMHASPAPEPHAPRAEHAKDAERRSAPVPEVIAPEPSSRRNELPPARTATSDAVSSPRDPVSAEPIAPPRREPAARQHPINAGPAPRPAPAPPAPRVHIGHIDIVVEAAAEPPAPPASAPATPSTGLLSRYYIRGA